MIGKKLNYPNAAKRLFRQYNFKIFLLFLQECDRNNPYCLDRAIETEPEWREAEHIPALGIAR